MEKMDQTRTDCNLTRMGFPGETPYFAEEIYLGFYHLSSFRCSDLGCWVYYENTLPRPPRSEH